MRHVCYRTVLFTTLFCTAGGIEVVRAADAPGPRLRMPDPLLSLRDMYPDLGNHSATSVAMREFQLPGVAPRIADGRPEALAGHGELPMTNAWQRLGDCRAPGGVRVLTLWRATAGSIALHAGRHGGPSLQWTSPSAAHGSTPRGLFDHLITGAGSAAR
jgi:hypothetical protein